MKSFRARSQLLVSRLEDGDEVLHLDFSDNEANGGEDVDSDGDEVSRWVRVIISTHLMYSFIIHCDSIIMWSLGSTGKNLRYNGPRYIHVTVVQNL